MHLRTATYGLFLLAFASLARADDQPPTKCQSPDLPTTWSPVERDVWTRLCTTGLADLNAGAAYGGRISPLEGSAFRGRTLGQDFLAMILQQRPFAAALNDGVIELRGIDVPTLSLDTPLLKKLVISGSRFGTVDIEGPDMAGMLDIDSSSIGRLRLGYGRIRGIAIANSAVSHLQISRLEVDFGLNVDLTEADEVDIALSKFHAGTSFRDSAIGVLSITSSAIDGAVAFGSSSKQRPLTVYGDSVLGRLNAGDSQIAGPLYLNELQWDPVSRLSLEDTTVTRLQFRADTLPKTVTVTHFGFSSWREPVPDTEALIDRIDASGSYDPTLLQKISDAYRDDANYDASAHLLYLKGWHDLVADHQPWSRFLRVVSWATVGFGVYPARGFAWFAGIVVVGMLVFRGGELRSGDRPHSWLAFCIDALVPGITFDEEHKNVRFAGWRNVYFYFMRLSGALLLFLVFKYLEAALPAHSGQE